MPQTIDMIDYYRNSGLSPFGWLHKACQSLLEGPGRMNLREEHLQDEDIVGYYRFLRFRQFQKEGRSLPLDYSYMQMLYEKYSATYLLEFDPSHQPLRSELRARILVDQPREDIVRATGLSMHIVATYERFYFDVRDCLSATCYILGMLGAPPMPGREIDELQRLAYGGGIRVLEAALLATRFQEPQWSEFLVNQTVAQLADDSCLKRILSHSPQRYH